METFEIDIRELGVSQLYLNQRKLEAVREKTLEEGFSGFEPLPVYDFGDGRKVLTDGHSRAFVALQKGMGTLRVYWDNDPNTTGKLAQKMYRMALGWCERAGVRTLTDLQSRVLQAPAYEFFWLERCRRGYNLITTRNKGALDKARELAPDLYIYGTERNLQTFYFEDEKGRVFKYYDNELRPERSDNQ